MTLVRVREYNNLTNKALPTSMYRRETERESRHTLEYLREYDSGVSVDTVDVLRDQIKSLWKPYLHHQHTHSKRGARSRKPHSCAVYR